MKKPRQKRKPTEWTKFKMTTPSSVADQCHSNYRKSLEGAEIWENSVYVVVKRVISSKDDGEDSVDGWWLSIRTHDREVRHDWREFQRIKNEICGAECEAVELYPAESRLVDTSNQFHLFVFEGYKFPFGYLDRLVTETEIGDSRQRKWRPDSRPNDCKELSPEKIRGYLDNGGQI